MFTNHLVSDDINPNPISTMTKKSKGCIKSAISNADNFDIPFPMQSGWKERALLLAATLFIDYRMFEDKGNNQGSVKVNV
jgi:hypothetical protein